MKINVKSSKLVKPNAETPGGTLWLSNLDLLTPASYHTQALYFYHFNGAADFFDTTVLKSALSRALVEFYPYAGRLKKDGNNRLEIDCNEEGVLFVEAECDATLDDLGDSLRKAELGLVPTVDYSLGISTFPLLLLQLTRFKCGGVSLGFGNEHHLVDGTSALHFTNSWSDIARSPNIKIPPFFDRKLLSARDPPRPAFPHTAYHPPPPLAAPLDTTSETAFSIFKITRDQLNELKAKCNEGNQLKYYTTYEVLVGHVWRCVCMARGLPADQETRLHTLVDGRSRLVPSLPPGFFGTVTFPAAPIARCGELVSNPLKYTVAKVHASIARMDDEFLRSAIDYIELNREACGKARGANIASCPNLGIISWARLPFYDADFGWGKPAYCGPGSAPSEGKSFVLPSPDKDGSLLYGVTLFKEHVKVFEKLFYEML